MENSWIESVVVNTHTVCEGDRRRPRPRSPHLSLLSLLTAGEVTLERTAHMLAATHRLGASRLLLQRARSSGPSAEELAKERRRQQMVKEVSRVQEELQAKTVREAENHLRLQQAKEVEMRTRAVADEQGGPTGREPTRYGDWERKGRVSDF